uniref:Stabilin 1 n=1 Tax=Electrophorus electricus TaxID=8005 RepID=A0A4W4EY81_ELEEL
ALFKAISNHCDEARTTQPITVCTSCAAAPAVVCPPGFRKTTVSTKCHYSILIGEHLQIQAGCAHSCEKVITIKKCCSNFWGSLCLRESCPSWQGRPCNWHGTCVDGDLGNGTCVCEEGYTGFACQKCLNVKAYGEHCSSVCSCVHGECNSGPDGDGQCYCQPPYSGPKCDKEGQNAMCECLPGFKKVGHICTGICLPNVCDVNAECSYKERGQFQCKCKEGYEGDGELCTPINPCSQNNGGCPSNSTTCEYTGPGKARCVCMSGMEGSNPAAGCRLRSTCTTSTCHRSARCETSQDGIARFVISTCFLSVLYLMVLSNSTEAFTEFVTELKDTILQNCGAPMPLSGPGPLTVFAPSNKAVDRSRDGSLIYMLTDAKHKLQELLKHHMYSKAAFQVWLCGLINSFPFICPQGRVLLGEKGIPFESKDIVASNGIIHIIDGILVPPSIIPIMPHRCDVNETVIVTSPCVKCSSISESQCPPGSIEMRAECCRGFYGPDCKPCIGGFQHPCYDNGTCSDGIHGDGTCRCNPGFKGIGCHICSDPNKHGKNCDQDCHCVHGVCDNRPNSLGVCRRGSCHPGYSGELCDQAAALCSSDGAYTHCHIHGYCKYSGDQMTCVCGPGYEGDGYSCTEVNLCLKPERGGCHINAQCVYAGSGNLSCVCNEGWTGDGILCVEVNNCLMEDRGGCHVHAECTPTGPSQVRFKYFTFNKMFMILVLFIYSTNFTVSGGYSVPSTYWNFNLGYFGNDCFKCPGTVDNWCSNNGKCQDGLFGNGTCLCNEGFHGTACEMCEAGRYGKDCKSECHCEHGKCLDGMDGNGQCICDKGWKGLFSFSCITGELGIKPACVCVAGYQGNGTFCKEIDLCVTNNGGCSERATCMKTSPGERSCTCQDDYKGDGIVCLGKSNNGGCSLNAVCRYTGPGERNCTCHIGYKGDGIECAGTVSRGIVYINNNTKIITSDFECSNGVMHFIDKVLLPYEMTNQTNLTVTAESYGYSMFSKLLQKTNLMDMVHHTPFHPFTMFWPTDDAFNSLPDEQKNWLYSEDHRDKLAAFMKVHITVACALPSERYVRSMYGSQLTFNCNKNLIILINGNDAKIIERHLVFSSGIAYGIDKVLEPPNIGAHCDDFATTEITVSDPCYYWLKFVLSLSPKNQTHLCRMRWDYGYRRHIGFNIHQRSFFEDPYTSHLARIGCSQVCKKKTWISKCCKNHYGRDCQVCPGGLEAPCGGHGDCDDGQYSSGTCKCYPGFTGTACELCEANHYGSNCTACNCTINGKCDDGQDGGGSCFCKEGWTGLSCESKIEIKPVCSPECHSNAVCRSDNQCECEPLYEGDGLSCTASALCSEYNGGCHEQAICTQTGINVTCTCNAGYSGDGFVCSSINRCVEEDNGGCSDFANCIVTGPNERRCECLPGYVGNGVQCLEKVVPPVDRCLEENGGCDANAVCRDLHSTVRLSGVFHLRSPAGKYKMNYTDAEVACSAEGATLATLSQLSDAQQLGMHLCVAGWMDGKRVGYPIRFPSVKCGDNHVGIVLYKDPVDVSSPYDAYCFSMKEVTCECGPGYIGSGEFCNGDLVSVVATNSNFSTISWRDMEYHISANNSLHFYEDLKHNTTIPSRLGYNLVVALASDNTQADVSLTNQYFSHRNVVFLYVRAHTHTHTHTLCLFLQDSPPVKLVNKQIIIDWNVPATNGLIHVIEGPLKAPPIIVSYHLY